MRTTSLLTATLALALATPARAQFGNITKKAEDALKKETKTDEKSNPPKFDDQTIELKENVLTRVVTGMRAGQRVTGKGGLSPAEMTRRSHKATEERAVLLEGRDEEFLRYQDRVSQHGNCMNDALTKAGEDRQAAMSQLIMSRGASDPQLMQDVQRLSMKQQERLAAGDTAGAQQATDSLMKRLGADLKADTTKAKAKCGPLPPKPAWLARTDSLNDLSMALLDEARAVEIRADTVAAQAASLGFQQYQMAEERVVAFALADGKGSTATRYSDAERSALTVRLPEIKTLLP